LQFIVEVPHDGPEAKHAAKSNCKLAALKLLSEIIKNESTGNYEEELLQILSGGNED
jgi:prenyltransferase beta subunit